MDLSLLWANETLLLMPERALHWPRTNTLFITDPHFGKAATFRHFGIPVPETSHDEDLNRLTRALQRTGAQQLIILGDFLHARDGNRPEIHHALQHWRDQWPSLAVTLIAGNHDRHAGALPASLNIQLVQPPWSLLPFTCCHHPDPIADQFVLAGHLHPAHRLSTSHPGGISAPCFHLQTQSQLMVLPAFGSFTGTARIQPSPSDLIYLVGPDAVLQAPNQPPRNKRFASR